MPFLDRIDIHVEVPRADHDKLTDQRFEGTAISSNADMRAREVREVCQLDSTGRALVRAGMQQMQMSARAFRRILKLARSELIQTVHLAEAMPYRLRRTE